LRENVTIHRTPGDAERAGFRACLRCHPKSAAGTPAEQAVERARAIIDADLEASPTLDELAGEVGLSPYHLLRTFRKIVGLTPKKYRDARRLDAFKGKIRKGDTVLGAAFEAGFGSSRGIYARTSNGLGMTPGAYRRGGEGLRIGFTILDSALGTVLVAATDRGLCAVLLGETADELTASLTDEFPKATIERSDEKMSEWGAAVARYLDGEQEGLDLPLDTQGTEFQRRVWRALQEIPYGTTCSYGNVAAMIGDPAATRAVAGACAGNRVALVIPCHRVLRKEGAIGGYRWGADRKQRLLELERGVEGNATL
jgi:AraC family transcriptional regulator of adaptative response/methylated-DNA-[protein]-cysteine methyltransferase